MLTILVKIFKALNSEQSPNQLAAAVSLAAILGLTPLLSLHNFLVIFVVLIFRVNLTIFLVTWPLFSLIGLIISPFAEQLGSSLLQLPEMQAIWTSFYNTIIGRWSNFYYSGVLGSLVISLGVAIIGYPVFKLLIVQYRNKWLKKFEQYHIVKLLKTSKIWQLYQSYSS